MVWIGATEVSTKSLMVDFVTLAPFIVWFFISIAAIIEYNKIQWYAPVACASYSTLLCGVATYRLWQHTHFQRAVQYHTQANDGEGGKKPYKYCRPDTWIAGFFASVALIWAILDIVANASISKAKAYHMPCNGECGTCTWDKHCKEWAAGVMADNPLTQICPPARHLASSTSDATFSCVADCAWMFLTSLFTFLWLIVLCRKPPKAAVHASAGSELSATPAPRVQA